MKVDFSLQKAKFNAQTLLIFSFLLLYPEILEQVRLLLWCLSEMLSLHMGFLTLCECNNSSEKEVSHPPKVIIHSALKTAIAYVNHSAHCISFPFKLVLSL